MAYWPVLPSLTAWAARVSWSARSPIRAVALALPLVSCSHELCSPAVVDEGRRDGVVARPQAGADHRLVAGSDHRQGGQLDPDGGRVAADLGRQGRPVR